MLRSSEPDEYVIATRESHTVSEFLDEAFGLVGLEWPKYIRIDSHYLRPAEVAYLLGDSAKAQEQLGWKPKVKFKELVRIMVESDLEPAKREAHSANFPGLHVTLEKSGT